MDNLLSDTFAEECRELFEELEKGLVDLEHDPRDRAILAHVFRAAHTIKGNAGMAGWSRVQQVAHVLEDVLQRARDKDLVLTTLSISILLEAVDLMRSLAVGERDEDVESVLARVRDVLSQNPLHQGPAGDSTSPSPSLQRRGIPPLCKGRPGGVEPGRLSSGIDLATDIHTYRVDIRPAPDVFASGVDVSLFIDDLSELGALSRIEVPDDPIPLLDSLNPSECILHWKAELSTDRTLEEIEGTLLFLRTSADISIKPIPSGPPPTLSLPLQGGGDIFSSPLTGEDSGGGERLRKGEPEPSSSSGNLPSPSDRKSEQGLVLQRKAESLRVGAQKLDTLLDLAGELAVAQDRVARLTQDVGGDTGSLLRESFDQLVTIGRQLQEEVLGIRMVPIGPTFRQMVRVARDAATVLGKKVRIDITGEDTELDKTMVDNLADPLKHLIRNAVDHGIETPELRSRSGKPEEGRIALRARHAEGRIEVEILDDGAGLNPDKIRARAESLGLIPKGGGTGEDVESFIFLPGFSTAGRVTEISGRGVGLDVVATTIRSLRGEIRVHSEPGRGSRFVMLLPLTLALLDSIVVSAASRNYVIPLSLVREMIRIGPEEYKTVEGSGEVILLRGKVIPIVRLHEQFGLGGAEENPLDAMMVVVDIEGRSTALMVDAVQDQQQAVIKSLEQNYGKVLGVAGATILGDGSVALVLDVPAIVHGPARSGRAKISGDPGPLTPSRPALPAADAARSLKGA